MGGHSMLELLYTTFKPRYIIGSAIILAGLFLIPTVLPSLWNDSITVIHASSSEVTPNESPNQVTNGLASFSDKTSELLDKLGQAPTNFASKVTTSAQTFGRATANAGQSTATAVSKAATITGSSVYKSLEFALSLPDKAFVASASIPSPMQIIRPEQASEVPIIDEQLAALYAAHTADAIAHPENQEQATPNITAIWPIHGRVTTNFGVPHRPYQVTHTGLDISSGGRSGATAIMPFKPGRVIDAVKSKQGLGNHVVIDHGDGLTSVYGHMSSLAVENGQEVTQDTVLGYEGSTGVSTGTHLHFEIRQDGQALNPLDFIEGRP